MHLLFLPTEIKSFPTTDSTFEYYANPFEYSKTVCLQNIPKTSSYWERELYAPFVNI